MFPDDNAQIKKKHIYLRSPIEKVWISEFKANVARRQRANQEKTSLSPKPYRQNMDFLIQKLQNNGITFDVL